jgi:hypothetical protein
LPRGEGLRDPVHRLPPQQAEIPAEPPPSAISIVPEAGVCSEEAPSTPAMDNVSEPTPAMTAIAERYPLLRNAL